MYPSRFERLAHYEPEVFQEYMQLLGVHRDDQIVLYSRGPLGGMLFSAKCYWLLKVYGHNEVSILDGGLDAWKKEGYEVESSTELPKVEQGNWYARNYRHKLVTFEELTDKDGSGKDIFEKAMDFNILDARIRAQYNNEQDTGLNSFGRFCHFRNSLVRIICLNSKTFSCPWFLHSWHTECSCNRICWKGREIRVRRNRQGETY